MSREDDDLMRLSEQLRSLPPEAWQLVDALPATPVERPEEPPARAPERRPAAARSWRLRLSPPMLAGLATALAAAFLIGFVVGGAGSGPGSAAGSRATAALVVLDPRVDGTRARVSLSGTRLVLRAHGLPVPAAGQYYEAWLMTSTSRLVALVSFRPDRRGDVRVQTQLPAPAHAYRYVDVSLQAAGQGSAHSGDSVLRAPTARL